MPVVNWLIAQVGVFGVLGGLFVATYGAFMLWYRDLIDSAEERRAFIESLSADTYLTRYRALLTGVLDWVDHAMAQWEIRVRELDFAGVSDARARNKDPWSYGLLDFALLAAILYPLATIFLQWSILGGPGSLGDFVILEAQENPWIRGATLCGIVLYVLLARFLFGEIAQGWLKRNFASLGLSEDVAGAGAGAVLVAWDAARRWVERRSTRPQWVLVLFILLLVPALIIGGALAEAGNTLTTSLLLFFGLLPVFNAVADFASTGATRKFLRKGLATGQRRWAFIDLGVGALILLMLGFAVILVVQAVVWAGGPALMDLQQMLAGAEAQGSMRNDPWAFLWLYITFGSTLLPTLVHLVIFLLSFATTGPGFVRRGIAALLEVGGEGRKGAGRMGLSALAGAVSAAITLAAGILWYGGIALGALRGGRRISDQRLRWIA